MVNRSPRIRTCLRAKALQRAGVNFPCTTAAFTLPHEPAGFVVLCQLAQGLSLVCGFCPPDQVRGRLLLARLCGGSSRTFDGTSFRRSVALPPLPSARTFGSIHYHEHHRFSYRGLPPHKFTPMPGVHKRLHRIANKPGNR